MKIQFTVPFASVQERPRVYRTKSGKPAVYMPAGKEQKIISQYALVAMVSAKKNPFKGDCYIQVTVYAGKGDGSNYLKLVEDGCNAVVYEDDKQCVLGSYRLYRDTKPERMDIEIGEI